MKILVTGACGFIASHLIDQLVLEGHEIIAVDDLSSGKKSNISQHQLKFFKDSVTDYSKMEFIFRTELPDTIYHLAAIASVQKCKADPLYSSEVNSRSTLHLLELAVKYKVKNFFFSSSAAIYGDDPTLPKREDSKVAPISIYGIDKYASEQYVMEYQRLKKINGTVFRFFNVFGKRQDPNSPYSGVLSIFYDQLIVQKQDSVTIFGDGKQSRDFTSVTDVVHAILLPLNSDLLSGKIYNVASGHSITLLEVISVFEKIKKKSIKINFKTARQGDIKFSQADISQLKELGFSAKYSFHEALSHYIAQK